MKKITAYISTFAAAALLLASCSKEAPVMPAEGEGSLQLSVALNDATRAEGEYDPLQSSILRIYDAAGNLIRRYKPATAVPDQLYLVAGSYKATVEAGEKVPATWNELSYYGEQPFSIEAQRSTSATVTCPTIHSAVKVNFDASIAAKLNEGAKVYVSAADEFSESAAEKGSVPTLTYAESGRTGYFLLPAGVSKLSWGFFGSLKESNEEVAFISNESNSIVPEAGKLYTLNFKYSDTPNGFLMSITIQVDENGEEHGDDFVFSPQPTFNGQGFGIGSTVAYTGEAVSVLVSATNPLSSLTVTADREYKVMNDGMVVDLASEGLTYAVTDECNGVLTLAPALLDRLSGGLHEIGLKAVDTSNGEGSAVLRMAKTGISDVKAKDCDLWANTATFKAVVTDRNATNVAVNLRKKGETAWTTIPAVKSEDLIYTAAVEPTWSEATNEKNHTVYTLTNGIVANTEYECQLVIGGAATGEIKSFTTSTTQAIPYGDMEDSSLSCFTTNNGSTLYWGSGNNSSTKSLCTQSTCDGMNSKCAKLAGTKTFGLLAAGNLFLGTFNFEGNTLTGHVGFGQTYTWEARPKALKLKLNATMGTVDVAKHAEHIAIGETDHGSVYMAIVDWNSRHVVSSGSKAPVGVWSPADGADAVSEGKIIGYAIYDVNTTNGTIDLTLPINYYDKVTRPSGKYTLVIACATSAYGDYFNGSSTSQMYVDDFEWVY